MNPVQRDPEDFPAALADLDRSAIGANSERRASQDTPGQEVLLDSTDHQEGPESRGTEVTRVSRGNQDT